MSVLDTPLTNLLSHALDITASRQAQVSQNIANIDTPGYSGGWNGCSCQPRRNYQRSQSPCRKLRRIKR